LVWLWGDFKLKIGWFFSFEFASLSGISVAVLSLASLLLGCFAGAECGQFAFNLRKKEGKNPFIFRI
jgi:hypothetical protein